MFYVYALYIEDQMFYIGKASMKHRRFDAHMSQARKKASTLTYRKMSKALDLGQKISMKPIQINMKEQDAFKLERELIAKYGRIDQGTGILTNHTDGGEGNSGYKHTLEARRKISEAGRCRKPKFGYQGGGRPATSITVRELDGTPIKTYSTISELNRETGKSMNALYNAIHNEGITKLWDRKVKITANRENQQSQGLGYSVE